MCQVSRRAAAVDKGIAYRIAYIGRRLEGKEKQKPLWRWHCLRREEFLRKQNALGSRVGESLRHPAFIGAGYTEISLFWG